MYILNCTCERNIEDPRIFWGEKTAKDIMIDEANECARNMNHDNCDWKVSEINLNDYITPEQKEKAKQILVDNGVEEDEAEIVLQAIGYALIDTELYPDKD